MTFKGGEMNHWLPKPKIHKVAAGTFFEPRCKIFSKRPLILTEKWDEVTCGTCNKIRFKAYL